MKLSRTLFLLLLSAQAFGQTLQRAEYFFDNDPGKGNGTSLSITQAASINETFNINITISSLTTGTHTFNIRFVDSNGHWSLFDTRTFFVLNATALPTASTLKNVEYFFDNDPGTGKATTLAISAAGTQNNTFVIGLGSLTQGFHQLAVRYQDNLGHWSLFANRTFYIVPPAATAGSTTVKKAEYFFDNDPGLGSGKPLAITAGNPQNNLFAIAISSLTSGFHQLAIRYQDNAGKWSLFANRTFYIVPNANASVATSISRAEYFFDSDPGAGKGTPYPIAAGSTQSDLFTIPINSLPSGFHQLCLRYQDNLGRWSVFTNRTFYIVPNANAAVAASINKAEYFFDSDPGVGKGTSYPITAGSPQSDLLAIPINSLSSGFHQLGLRFQDNLGRWSTFANRTFYIIPGSVVTKTLQRLEYFVDTDPGFGSATALSFTPAATLNQQFAINLAGVSTGSHTLYVRTKDSQGYWSTKVSAGFTVLNCTPPNAPVAPAVSQCGAGSVNLVASGAAGTQVYRWYADASTTTVLFTGGTYPTPSINATTTYYASIYDPSTGCESNRTAVNATVVNIPKPTLNLTGSLAVCAGNSETLIAPAGFVSYAWSNGLTTQTIPVSTSGSYTVTVSDGTCTSPSSDPFVFTVNPLPVKPLVNATGGGTLCGSGTVTLSAPSGFSFYSWSSGQSTSTIPVNSPGDYFVTVTDANGCQSAPSNIFSVTSSAPAKPVIAVTGNTTLCTGSTVSLAAPTGFSGYTWSNGATSPTITVNASGSFTVTVSNGSCTSVASDPVVVTTALPPTKPVIVVTGNTTLCNGSTVSLAAPSGFSNYVWSDGETSPTIIVNTGGSFTVTVSNGSCTSVASDPVTVTTTSPPTKPVIVVTGNTTLCNGSTVSLAAPSGFSNYVWSDGETSPTIIVNTGGSFTVTVSNGSCTSPTSDPVVVTQVSIPSQPTVQIAGSAVLCTNSFVGLSAPVGFASYLWSDGETTKQIVVSGAGNYSVQVGNSPNCLSQASSAVSVTVSGQPCSNGNTIIGNPSNIPPAIAEATIDVPIGNEVFFNLKSLITKGSTGIDFGTLRIAQSPASGASATIDANYDLVLNYTGSAFAGKESVGVQVCDSLNSCTERSLSIDVVADVVVFNAVSPFPDGLNDFFHLKYIDQIEETKKNKVVVVDRNGNEVFSISDYNNVDRVFKGLDNTGNELSTGTYYYRIDFNSGRPTLTGFISLKR